MDLLLLRADSCILPTNSTSFSFCINRRNGPIRTFEMAANEYLPFNGHLLAIVESLGEQDGTIGPVAQLGQHNIAIHAAFGRNLRAVVLLLFSHSSCCKTHRQIEKRLDHKQLFAIPICFCKLFKASDNSGS